MKKNLSLIIISLILVFGSLEILLKFLYPQNLDGWYATRDETGLNILKANAVFIIELIIEI